SCSRGGKGKDGPSAPPRHRPGLNLGHRTPVAKSAASSMQETQTFLRPPVRTQPTGEPTMTGTVEDRLTALGLILPAAPAPVANYVPFAMAGNLLFISGQISKAADGTLAAGALGRDIDIAGGQSAARHAALNVLAQAKAALGDLDRIGQIVRLTGFVNAVADFKDHPAVINGASDLMVE